MKREYDKYDRKRSHSPPHRKGFNKYRRVDADPINTSPSKVLHIRSLPLATTEADILEALSHFGNVSYVKLIANGHMALAEFTNMEEARACVAYSRDHDIMVRQHPISLNYSTSEKIQRSALESEYPSKVIVVNVTNKVFPVDIDTMKTICGKYGNINRICFPKKFGLQEMNRALVEFETVEQATEAKNALNGCDIYDDACTLKIEYGRMNKVIVTENCAEQWDYTGDPALNPNTENPQVDGTDNGRNEYDDDNVFETSMNRDPPFSEGRRESFSQSYAYADGEKYGSNETNYRDRGSSSYRGRSRRGSYYSDAGQSEGGYFNHDRRSNTFVSSFPSNGCYPRKSSSISSYRGKRSSREHGSSISDRNDRQSRGSKYDDEREYSDRREKYDSSRRNSAFNDSRDEGRRNDEDRRERSSYGSTGGGESHRNEGHGDREQGSHYSSSKHSLLDLSTKNGAVVMVYGINPRKFNCDKLFNLLCCYGNCLKIKYMYSKTDTCMVQMGSSEEAESVLQHLQNLTVFGTTLSFRPSKQNVVHDVIEPHTLEDGTLAFRDYSNSTVQRFSTPEMAALNKIVFPNLELYWFGAPPLMNAELMKKLFTQKHAHIPVKVNILGSTTVTSSGTMRFRSTQEATEVLMTCNNMVIAGGLDSPPYIFKLSFASPEHKKEQQ